MPVILASTAFEGLYNLSYMPERAAAIKYIVVNKSIIIIDSVVNAMPSLANATHNILTRMMDKKMMRIIMAIAITEAIGEGTTDMSAARSEMPSS